MFNKFESTFWKAAISMWMYVPDHFPGRDSLLSQDIGSVVVGFGSDDSVTLLWGGKRGYHLACGHHCLSFLGKKKTLMLPLL